MVAATEPGRAGGFRLPEAIDRFLMRLSLRCQPAAELRHPRQPRRRGRLTELQPVVSSDEVLTMSAAVRSVHLADR
ncbi:MAG: hypothetical protein R2713_21315 [Ilumatobacteraceae bacterium]